MAAPSWNKLIQGMSLQGEGKGDVMKDKGEGLNLYSESTTKKGFMLLLPSLGRLRRKGGEYGLRGTVLLVQVSHYLVQRLPRSGGTVHRLCVLEDNTFTAYSSSFWHAE